MDLSFFLIPLYALQSEVYREMRVVLATSNGGKVKEIKRFLSGYDIIPYTDLIEKLDIVEDGATFQENANIKSERVYRELSKIGLADSIVMSDDSGISIDALDGRPGIYSARFAGEGASDRDNLQKAVEELQKLGVESSPAHYTASISITSSDGTESVHGWMYGEVSTEIRGSNGFGYDPIFTPKGFSKTVGELSIDEKEKISHRVKALQLAKVLLSRR
jgi:XTP/dITP diphosphohydrolase